MAASVSVVATVPTNDHTLVFTNVTFDSSYPTGGEAISASDVGLQGILDALVGGADDATYHGYWDNVNRLLKLYVEDGTSGIEAEAANTSDQSAVVLPVLFVGV